MSKIEDIKNRTRQQKNVTPTQALSEEIEERESSKKTLERKRVSFDLRTDLHKELKMQSLIQEKNIYIIIEEALENYLSEKK